MISCRILPNGKTKVKRSTINTVLAYKGQKPHKPEVVSSSLTLVTKFVNFFQTPKIPYLGDISALLITIKQQNKISTHSIFSCLFSSRWGKNTENNSRISAESKMVTS